MLVFVNAKLNLGLNIVRRRPDGYHDLETVFYPVGLHNGTPENPESFCDILEIRFLAESSGHPSVSPDASPSASAETVSAGPEPADCFILTGQHVDCPLEKNLVFRAVRSFRAKLREARGKELPAVEVRLEKHLPDGAGLGGGSADAGLTLRVLNHLSGDPLADEELAEIALGLGADCPFFIFNTPAFAEGVGERLTPVGVDLKGWWCLIVKPAVYVSTKEAFAGVTPRRPDFDLRRLPELPVEEWRDIVHNDFEDSIFPQFPELAWIKETLYGSGAVYATMSGSGSSLFGLFRTEKEAKHAATCFDTTIFLCLL